MKRHLFLNIAIPALALAGSAVGLALMSHSYSELAQKPTEEQLQDVSRRIEKGELSKERLRTITIDVARAQKKLNQSASETLRSITLATVFCTGWLVIGCYQLLKKAPQAGPGSTPPLRGGAP